MTALMSEAAAPMRNVAPIPDCRLKCCGSMPTAANPVSTPPAPPLTAAATRPFSHNSIVVVFIETPEDGHGSAVPLRNRHEGLLMKRGRGVVEDVVGPGVVVALLARFSFVELFTRRGAWMFAGPLDG